MPRPLDDVLAEVAAATLERLAFLFAAPAEGEPEPAAAPMLGARLEFRGPISGAIAIAMATPAAGELAANMLGLPDGEAPDEAARADALKELLNVICGNLLPAVAGETAEFSLGAPELAGAEEDGPAGAPDAACRLQLDGGLCRIALRLDGGGDRVARSVGEAS